MIRRLLTLTVACALLLCCARAEQTDTSQIADAGDQIAAEDVLEEGMTPVTAEQLVDGVYDVEVKSSSSMFKIAAAQVVKEEGGLTARLTIASDSYLYLYPGTAEAASQASRDDLIEAQPLSEGGNLFILPIDALDAAVDCAAFSRAKQQWYPRTLVFRADSLPFSAFADAAGIDLADGVYTIDVKLSGGSGRTQVESPATLTVEGGMAVARIAFNTAKIDFVVVNGVTLEPVAGEENAVFLVPVETLSRPTTIDVDSTVMKPATLVSYTLIFDAATIQ